MICLLEEGQRLNKPKQAPNYVANIMSNCWKDEPNDRPTFSVLEECMESLLAIEKFWFSYANENFFFGLYLFL